MTRESQEFKAAKKRKIIAGCAFLAIIFFITLIKGGSLFQKELEIVPGSSSDPSVSSFQNGEAGVGSQRGDGKKPEVQHSDGQGQGQGQEAKDAKDAAEPMALIVVDVAGAVKNPGILRLEEGSRVFQALASAGGITEKADLRDINQAQVLSDGEKLYIPTGADYEDENAGALSGAAGAYAASGRSVGTADSGKALKTGKVNINTANSSELQTLTGVGPATAERILQYRKESGKFQSIEDLKSVKGIGDKTFEKLRDNICVK